MLDIKFIRENPDKVKEALKKRNLNINLDSFLKLDSERRSILTQLDELRAQKNKANDEISQLLKEKKDPKERISSMKSIASKIDELEAKFKTVDISVKQEILFIPNIPHESIPVGDESKKKIIREWGKVKRITNARTHIELSEHLDIIDFACAAKISGSNFILFKGQGARLERALLNFMLDLHTKHHGYTEVFPPFLVNRASMTGTGQLPKMEDDMYRLKDDDLFLIPTAEVPVTNIFRDTILDEQQLPIYYTAYTACFRREAGSYGKDTKGLMRVHQFDKVELVKFVKPDNSYAELETLLGNAEAVLQALELPYRVAVLPTQEISFAAAKCYDIEAYASGVDKWLEVSSCSNFESFQARRANIRFRDKDKKVDYVHTLNGSGVALARTVIAILENYQNPDGTINIPKVLIPYMDGNAKIN